jgi:hypothetical protein
MLFFTSELTQYNKLIIILRERLGCGCSESVVGRMLRPSRSDL